MYVLPLPLLFERRLGARNGAWRERTTPYSILVKERERGYGPVRYILSYYVESTRGRARLAKTTPASLSLSLVELVLSRVVHNQQRSVYVQLYPTDTHRGSKPI